MAGTSSVITGNPDTYGPPTGDERLKQIAAKIASLKTQINGIDSQLKIIDKAIANKQQIDGKFYVDLSKLGGGSPRTPEAKAVSLRESLLDSKSKLQKELASLQTGDTSGGGQGTNGTNTSSPTATFSETVIYNVPAVKEAYFKSNQSFYSRVGEDSAYWKSLNGTSKFDSYIYAGNTPGAVSDAEELWKKNVVNNSKGMIQTWQNPAGSLEFLNDGTLSPVTGLPKSGKVQRYGFQFIYNPTTIDMTYGGVADVSPGYAASGQDPFILSNPTVFQSSIDIQILLNRMYDIKYLSKGGALKKGATVSSLYSGKLPTATDLKKIYNKGTMYDVEFLLQTMFPYKPMKTELRGKTSDIGFLGPMPVELHLGNKLRYLTQISSIRVNHIIFDNRMVPLYTAVSITANRIPDNTAGITGGAA